MHSITENKISAPRPARQNGCKTPDGVERHWQFPPQVGAEFPGHRRSFLNEMPIFPLPASASMTNS